MIKTTPITIAMLGSLAFSGAVLAPAAAQDPSLAGKNVTMVFGFGPGGGFWRPRQWASGRGGRARPLRHRARPSVGSPVARRDRQR